MLTAARFVVCSIATLVSASVHAEAPDGKPIVGLFELVSHESGGKSVSPSQQLKEEMRKEGIDLVSSRMTFELSPTKLVVTTFVFERSGVGKGKVCQAALSTDIAWQGDALKIPVSASASARYQTIAKQSEKTESKTGVVRSTSDTKVQSDTDTCEASVTAIIFKASRRGKQLVLFNPASGGQLIFEPTTPNESKGEELAKRL